MYATAPNSDAHDVDLACRAAGRAFETWRWSTPGERQRALLKLADVIEADAAELVAAELSAMRISRCIEGIRAAYHSEPVPAAPTAVPIAYVK